jgi:hypothetical protein
MSGSENDKIRSLRELPRDVEPPHDLWQGIEARLAADAHEKQTQIRASRRGTWASRGRLIGAAAMIATLAVGIWIGRHALPAAQHGSVGELSTSLRMGEPEALHAAYMMGPRYTRERAELAKSLEAQVAALPPESRAKVMSSLATIHDSMRDLEAALGHDPSNALLQELLVNTYQDEMRVLTAVHEAGDAGKGI